MWNTQCLELLSNTHTYIYILIFFNYFVESTSSILLFAEKANIKILAVGKTRKNCLTGQPKLNIILFPISEIWRYADILYIDDLRNVKYLWHQNNFISKLATHIWTD